MPGGVVLGQAVMELSTDNSKFVGGLQEAARQSDSAFSKIAKTAAATAAGILVYKGLGAAIGAVKDTIGGLAAGFEQQLNILQAVSGAGTEQMAALSAQAKALGNDLTLPKTSAKDAAEAMTELGKAGLSINNIMGASKGVLQLAAAGNLSNARAAEIAANALNAFGLAGTEATRVADLLAAAANASSLEVTDAADAMQMSAAIFASAGIPIEDLITSISELGNAGIKGSDAGTSLKQMLLQLQTPTNKAKDLMRDMGFSVYDASGNMVSMRDIIGRLQVATAGMTQQQRDFALGTIFGSDAIRSANVLIRDGVAGFDTMKDAVTKEGAAAALAAARNKGFTGALDGLKSAIETVQITIGSLLIPSLTRMIRSFAYGVTQIEPLAHLFSLGFNGGQIGGEFSRIEKAVFAAGQTFRTIVQFVREFVGTVRRELLPSLDPLRPQFAQLGDSLLRLGAALPQLMPLLHDLGTVLLNVGRRYLPLLVVSWTLWLNVLTTSVDLLTRFIGALTDSEGRVTKLGRAVEIVAGTVVGLWALERVAEAIVGTGEAAIATYRGVARTLQAVNSTLNPMAGATRKVADNIIAAGRALNAWSIDKLETAYIRSLYLADAMRSFAINVAAAARALNAWSLAKLNAAALQVVTMATALRDFAATLGRLGSHSITITQDILTKGAAWIGDFAGKTVEITQHVLRTGAEWITDFGDRAQKITQEVTVQTAAAGKAGADVGESVANNIRDSMLKAVPGIVVAVAGTVASALIAAGGTALVATGIGALVAAIVAGLVLAIMNPRQFAYIEGAIGALFVNATLLLPGLLVAIAPIVARAIGDTIVSALGLLGSVAGSIGSALSSLFVAALALLGSTAGAIGTALSSVFMAGLQLATGITTAVGDFFTTVLHTVFGTIPSRLASAVASMFSTVAQQGVQLIRDLLTAQWGAAAQAAMAIVTAVFVKFPSDVISALSSGFTTILAAFVKLGFDIGSAVAIFVGQTVGAFVQLVTDIAGAVAAFATAIVGAFVQLGTDIGGAVTAFVTNLISSWSTALGDIATTTGDKLGETAAVFSNVFGGIWSFITGWITEFSAGYSQGFTDWTETARGGLQTIEGIFNDGFASILGAWDAFASGVSAIVNGIKDDVIGVFRSMVDEVRGIVNGLVNAVNGVIGRINSALTFNVSIPGVDLPSAVNALGVPDVPSINFGYASNIPTIQGLYEGGIVRHPMLATIAERGPEAVIPLSDIRSVLWSGISAPAAPRTNITQLNGRSNGHDGNGPEPREIHYHHYGDLQHVYPNVRNGDNQMREWGMAF